MTKKIWNGKELVNEELMFKAGSLTPEESEALERSILKVSTPTGVNIFDVVDTAGNEAWGKDAGLGSMNREHYDLDVKYKILRNKIEQIDRHMISNINNFIDENSRDYPPSRLSELRRFVDLVRGL